MTDEVFTVNLLADHKGFKKPRANGDEYMVDAVVDVSTYDASGVVLEAKHFGLSSITAVMHTGTSNVKFYPTFVIDGSDANNFANQGNYTSAKSFTMLIVDALQATPAEVGDGGTHSGMQFRLRVFGNL